MKRTVLSTCEQTFIIQAIREKKRLDGRKTYERRPLKISFGNERGTCNVCLGQTRVLAAVSCEVTPPLVSRSSEGLLRISVELSPMADPNFEAGRLSEYGIEVNRILERCLFDAKAVDLESLCIVSGEKVWCIQVYVHILNNDGNIIDCASIAAIAALSHFRRPDVTVDGEDVVIHSTEDRNPVPLNLHHFPICVTFVFFDQGNYLLVDPIEKEERVMDGKMVIAMNSHKEICTIHMAGKMLLLQEQVIRCSHIAAVNANEIVTFIKECLAADEALRSKGDNGMVTSLVNAQYVKNCENVDNIKDEAVTLEKAVQKLEVSDQPILVDVTDESDVVVVTSDEDDDPALPT